MSETTQASGATGPQGDAATGAVSAPAVLRVLEVIGASVQTGLETVGISARFGVQVARARTPADPRTDRGNAPGLSPEL